MTQTPAVEAKQQADPKWGEDYCNGKVAYVTSDGTYTNVWMFRRGQRVRFYDTNGVQVGPQHANVAPALYWAAANGWIDPFQPGLSVACIMEVRNQIAGKYTESGERIA